jgi:hypothetical protein
MFASKSIALYFVYICVANTQCDGAKSWYFGCCADASLHCSPRVLSVALEAV